MKLDGDFIFSFAAKYCFFLFCDFKYQLIFSFAMSSKQFASQPLKMQPGKDQFHEHTRMDVFNAPKVQYVNINIQSLHIHESGMN